MTGPGRAAVRVPCSTSNLGAGFDCVGLALDRFLEASFEPGEGDLTLRWEGGAPTRIANNLLAMAFRRGLAARGRAARGELRVRSDIPVSRGLGSSAASLVAGTALAALAAGGAVDPDEAFADAARAEGHGDNAAPSAYGGLRAVVGRGSGRRVVSLTLAPGIGFAFAAPPTRVSTRVARAALPSMVTHAAAVEGLARVAALLQGLATADSGLLALGLDDALHVPHRLPLIAGGAEALAAALEAGAWGATVSGSGSGLLAVGPPERAEALAHAMAGALARRHDAGAVIAFPVRPVQEGVAALSPDAPAAAGTGRPGAGDARGGGGG